MKKLKKVKINKAKIYSIFSIVLVSLMLISTLGGNSVYAELNPNDTGMEATATTFNNIVSELGELASSGLGFIATFINQIGVVIFFMLASIFSGVTGSVFPSPDNIVFNKIAIFDVNFFNPNSNSIYATANKAGNNIILKLYNSFQSIAVSVFILAAVIVGIKLALSTLASEKAACKKAMLNWLVGIVVLFLMRLIIAAIFELNELIVWKISLIADSVQFTVYWLELIPWVGNAISNIVNACAAIFTGDPNAKVLSSEMPGYTGLITKFMLKGNGGDIVSSIVTFVIIGQMLSLMVVYGKRLIYTMMLGVMAPLVVVFDTLGKVLKGSSNVLSNWFREFATLVFSQSLHAIVVAISLIIIGEFEKQGIASKNMHDGLMGIVAIIMISSLIKFDKLIKQIFGLSDGMLGSMKGAGQNVRQAMMGAKAGIGSIVDNKKKYDTAKKGLADAEKKRAGLVAKRGEVHFNAASSNILSAAQASSKPEDKRRFVEEFDKHMASAEKDGYEISAEQKKALFEKRDEIVKGLEGNTVVNNNNGNTVVNAQGDSNVKSEGGVSQVNNNGGRTETRLSGGQTRLANLSGDDFAREFTRSGTIEGAKLEGEARRGNANIRMSPSGAALSGNIENINNVANSTNINTQTATTNANVSTNNSNTSSTSSTSNTSNSSSDGAKKKDDEILKEMKNIIKEIKNSKNTAGSLKSINEQIADADKAISQTRTDLNSASFASLMGTANTAMGGAIGIGMGEDLADAIGKGGLATAAFDAAAEKIGKSQRVGGTSVQVMEKMDDMKSKLLGEMSKTTRNAAKAMDRTANMNNL